MSRRRRSTIRSAYRTISTPGTRRAFGLCRRSAWNIAIRSSARRPGEPNPLEPIARLIGRPNETNVGKMPNEAAQSLIFDDSTLLKVDKFSGWDRAEGGTRLNYAIQYTAQFNQAGSINVLAGQSYQLF